MQDEGKLSELNLTEEEMGCFTKAFKDETFRKMLWDYAEEIADPENRKQYEEEIAILEKERGNSIQFIHPTPFKCIRTSVNGQNKCYINICASDKIGQPSCKRGLSDEEESGHHWFLPYSLPPEKKELDPKGNKILIYDVIFHPDTLHMASANSRFMDMVTSVAIQNIQDGFNICLDKTNIKTMSTKYKGNASLQACVIRKPIPGFKAKDADPLSFSYNHDKTDHKATVPKEVPKNSPSLSRHLANTQRSTKPHYTLKYRSVVDLQDFRCTRVSTQSPRPKEIILTIDLPLLESMAAITLEVEEKSLLLESQNPVYKLELSLAYAVDEDKGAAKFNKQNRQLVVTLPVRPPPEGLPTNSSAQGSANDMHDPDGVCERDSEVEPEDHSEARAAKPQENTAAEETGDTCEEEGAEVSQQQESNGLRLCEEHQDGTKMEEHVRVTDETDQKGYVTIQEVQACMEKKVESEAIREIQEEKTFETELESKAPIRDDFIKTEKALKDLPGASEPIRAAEEMNEDLESEKDIANNSVPPDLLMEVREDGSLRPISDHVTTAGFSFHNSLLFELD
ncbi:protein kintoun-like [Eucyclogobius newberryi]|uniref:protein kintoun-like n=1 Tax=Eucyclogobius newberryi TaxID=166745 RepID=UPI003B5B4EF6